MLGSNTKTRSANTSYKFETKKRPNVAKILQANCAYLKDRVISAFSDTCWLVKVLNRMLNSVKKI